MGGWLDMLGLFIQNPPGAGSFASGTDLAGMGGVACWLLAELSQVK